MSVRERDEQGRARREGEWPRVSERGPTSVLAAAGSAVVMAAARIHGGSGGETKTQNH
jgi:hypothetical protein